MAVFDCVVFYFAFGEKVSKLHLIGVVLMFIGIGCIGAAAATKESEDIDEDVDTGGRSVFLNGILAILVGLGGPMTMALQHYIIRRFSKGYTGLNQAFDVAPVINFIFTFFLIPLKEKMTITWMDIFIGTAAEVFMEIARILVSYSVEKGLAGPASALISTQALH